MVEKSVWPAAWIIILALVLATAVIVWQMPNTPKPADNTAIEASLSQIQSDVTALKAGQTVTSDDKVDAIYAKVTERDTFKATCLELADAEWALKGNKAVFNELRNIDEKEDITSITVKDSDVSSINIGKGNCVVTEELKVRYENSEGESVKAYVNVDTTVKDGEVDEQTLDLA